MKIPYLIICVFLFLSGCHRIGVGEIRDARREPDATVEVTNQQETALDRGMIVEDAVCEETVVKALELIEEGLRVGDSRSVIDGYEVLASKLSNALIPRETKAAYGLALIRTGEFERAVDTLWGILQEGPGDERVIRLQYEIADRFAEREELFQTREVLAGMVEEHERDALEIERAGDLLDATWIDFDDPMLVALSLKALEAERIYRVRGDGGEAEHLCLEILEEAPETRPAIFAGELVEQIREDRRLYVGAAIEEVDRLIDARDLRSAKTLLLEIQKTIYIDPAQQDEIDDLLSFIDLKSPGIQVDGTWYRAEDAEMLHQARVLMDDGKLEEAYEAFSGLADSDYADQAEAGMERTRNLIAHEWRKRASALFLKASLETNRQRKVEGLKGSRDLLLHVLEHYPGSDYEEKIRRNLETVEKAIREIDGRILR